MYLSVIIVNWNTSHLLSACLESLALNLQELGQPDVETIVIDNASADDSAQMVGTRFPWVKLIVNQENAGFARANNQALALSSGRYLLLLNPDTQLDSGALRALYCFISEHPRAGMVGARLLNPDGSLQTSCYRAPTLFREFLLLFHLDGLLPSLARYPMSTWNLETPQVVDVLKGACVVVRREVLDEAGMFDDEYFMYSEEVDLCHRVRRCGWDIYWLPTSVVVHYEGQSTKQAAREMFIQLYRSKLLYFRKHHGWLAAFGFKFLLLSAAVVRLLFAPLLWAERGEKQRRHRVLAGHYLQLARQLPGM